MKKRRKNYSSSDVDEAITKIQTGEISQAKAVCKYGIPRQTLVQKCRNKIENLTEKRPGSLPVLGESADKGLVQWTLYMQKQGLPVGREMIIQKASEIHRYMFVSMRYVGLIGWGRCERFTSRHGKLTLRTAQVIKRARKEAISETLQSLFCKICQHIIEWTTEKEQLWNIDETGFIQKQNSRKVFVSKGFSNVWSKCSDANFHMTFVVCFSAAKSVAPPLLILPGKRLNGDVFQG